MNELDVLNAARKALIERWGQTFKSGNVFIVAYPRTPPQVMDEHYQLSPSGSGFDAEGGGNLRERFSFGLRISLRIVGDTLAIHEQLLKQMNDRVQLATKALHQHYEPEIAQQEPFFLESQSPVRPIESDATGTSAYVDLTFRTMVVLTIDQIIAQPPEE